ncbi:hypothetical protein Tco_0671036 [Tanacetum coccineum]
MHTIRMTMQQVQFNSKFLNALPPEWSKFVTDVKLAKSLYTINYDKLYAYLMTQQPQAEFPRLDSSLVVPTFQQGEDLTDCINKLMAFLSSVASRGRAHGETVHSAKKPRKASWFKEKLMLAEAQEAGQILDEEQLSFLADPRIDEAPVAHCDSDVLSKVPYSDTYLNDMIDQDVQEMLYSEQTHIMYYLDNEITSDSNIIPYSQYMQESQNAGIQDTNSFTPNDLLFLSLAEQMTDHVANLDKEN